MQAKSGYDIYKLWMSFAAFVVIIAGLKAASSIIVPILLAIFIATIAAPLMFFLQDRGLPRIVAFFTVLLLVVLLLFGIGVILSSSLDGFLASIAGYRQRWSGVIISVRDFLNGFGIDFIQREDLENLLDPSGVLRFANSFFRSFSVLLSNSFFIFLAVTFMLFETSSLKKKIFLLLKKDENHENPFEIFSQKLNKYLLIKTLASLATGIIIAMGLWLLQVEFALMLGLIAFLLNYVPSIGSIIAAIPAVVVALLGLELDIVISVVLLYLCTNILIGNFVEPRFLGKGLGLSVLVVFLSLLFWGFVFGPIGMFLAVPLSMTIKIALESHPSTGSLAMLLSDIDTRKDSQ
ncbi:MAG: AI-2E family transporter [Sulfurospirillum sp.]|nr:AI-2E family transporter [Sulfurospirillum sp.]